MKLTVVRTPVPALIIDQAFGQEKASEILAEIFSLEKHFAPAKIFNKGGDTVVSPEVRSNTMIDMDKLSRTDEADTLLSQSVVAATCTKKLELQKKAEMLMRTERSKYLSLRYTEQFIQSKEIHSFMSQMPYPICRLAVTNYAETQISRYGGGEKYEWHYDHRISSDVRTITMVYYCFKEPKAWEGGELVMTNGMVFGGRMHVPQTPVPQKLTVRPFHDRVVFFDSRIPHMVTPTTGPIKTFKDARFSVQLWIGWR